MDARRIMSGTWAEVWLDDDKLGEVKSFQAKVAYNKEKVNVCGQLATDTKITSTEGTGTLTMYKVNTRVAKLYGDKVQAGQEPRFTIVGKVADPDAAGTERVALSGVSFDDETIADWEAGQLGQVNAPFTFLRREWLDTIDP